MRDPTEELAELEAQSLRRRLRPLDGPQQPLAAVDGRPALNFSSNDYLGLANHPELKARLAAAVEEHGAGSGASRLVCGNFPPHIQLEAALARAKGAEAALAFSSGYAAAVGCITALVRPGDAVLLDKLCHASLIDGAKLSGAAIRVFPHNRLDRLEALLAWAQRETPATGRALVVTESIFSMDGDAAPLREIVELKNRHGAWLLVDDAHGFGIYGRDGGGLASSLGLGAAVDIHLGTLSKAAGLSGGFVAARQAIVDLLVNKARSFIYSTAPPPSIAAAASWVVGEFLPSPAGQAARDRLWANAAHLAGELGLPSPQSAIIPLAMGSAEAALAAADALRQRGFLIPAIRYPTVARDAARLRLTLTASHTAQQVAAVAAALRGIAPEG